MSSFHEHESIHGPAEAFKWAITNDMVNFIGAWVFPGTTKDPCQRVQDMFARMKRQVVPGRVNIIVFPEFFFNRLYTEPRLTTTQVEQVLEAQREYFSGCANVLCSLCFFHVFNEEDAPDWLKLWDAPNFVP